MLGTLFKALFVTLIIVAITAVLGLTIMAGVAGTHDVKPIDMPKASSLAYIAGASNYVIAYRVPMEFNTYRTIAEVIANASFTGDSELHRSEHEVVYGGSMPGLTYQVGYVLDRDAYPPTLAMVTVARITDRKGRYTLKVLRPIYRCLSPYLLDRLASRAPN